MDFSMITGDLLSGKSTRRAGSHGVRGTFFFQYRDNRLRVKFLPSNRW